MREVLQTAGTAAAALLLIGIAVFGWNDTSTFVPGPEVVAEGFARQIATRRYDLALNHLASGTRKQATPHALKTRFEPLFEVTGTINKVHAERRWMGRDGAAARATIEGDNGTVTFEVALVRENGLWRIDRLPDLVR